MDRYLDLVEAGVDGLAEAIQACKQREITAWIAAIRDLTQKKARQTGRAYPLGLRIPAALGALRSMGLDVRAIVDAGIVDLHQSQQLLPDGMGPAAGSFAHGAWCECRDFRQRGVRRETGCPPWA